MQLVTNISAIYSPELVVGTTTVSREGRMQVYAETEHMSRLAVATTRYVS